MVSVCTVPARGGRSCERFGGYKTINRIPLPLPLRVCVCVCVCEYSSAHSAYITMNAIVRDGNANTGTFTTTLLT